MNKSIDKNLSIRIIINPKAGRNISRKFIEKPIDTIKKFFSDKKITVDIKETKRKGHAKILAKNKRFDIIIAVGGDGTINEVINGFSLENSNADNRQLLGIIPTGSENVFAKEMNIPLNVKRACEVILRMNHRKIDLGLVNNKRFIFTLGIGFDAQAITQADPFIKQIIGKHSYLLAGFKTLFSYKQEEITITNKNKKHKGYFALVNNLKLYGGKMIFTPDAKPDDGYFDVCLFKKRDIFSMFKNLASAKSGHIKTFGDVEIFKCKEAIITSKKPVLYHTDAEISGKTPVSVSIKKHAIDLIIP